MKKVCEDVSCPEKSKLFLVMSKSTEYAGILSVIKAWEIFVSIYVNTKINQFQ